MQKNNGLSAYERLAGIATEAPSQEQVIVLPKNFGQSAEGVENNLDLPVGAQGHTYKELLTEINKTAAEMKTDIETVILRVNGHEETKLTGADYFNTLEKFGVVIKDGVMPIVFNPFRTAGRTVGDEDAFNMGTLDLESLEVIIVPKSGLATAVKLGRVRAVILPNQNSKFVLSIKKQNFSGIEADSENFESVTMAKEHGHLILLDIQERANIERLSFHYRSMDLYRELTPTMLDVINANQILPWEVDGSNMTLNFCRGGRLAGMLEAEGSEASVTLYTGTGVASTVPYIAVRAKAVPGKI